MALEVLLQSFLHKFISFLLLVKAIEQQTLHSKGFCPTCGAGGIFRSQEQQKREEEREKVKKGHTTVLRELLEDLLGRFQTLLVLAIFVHAL